MTGAKRTTNMYWKTQQTLVWQQTRCYARARQSLLFGLSWMLKISVWQKLSPFLPVVKFMVPLARNHRLKSRSLPLSKTLIYPCITYFVFFETEKEKKQRHKSLLVRKQNWGSLEKVTHCRFTKLIFSNGEREEPDRSFSKSKTKSSISTLQELPDWYHRK